MFYERPYAYYLIAHIGSTIIFVINIYYFKSYFRSFMVQFCEILHHLKRKR